MSFGRKDEFKMTTAELVAEIKEVIDFLKSMGPYPLSLLTEKSGILVTLRASLDHYQSQPDPDQKFKTELEYALIAIRVYFPRDYSNRLYLPATRFLDGVAPAGTPPLSERGIIYIMKTFPALLAAKGYWLGIRETSGATLGIAKQLGNPKDILTASAAQPSVAADAIPVAPVSAPQQAVADVSVSPASEVTVVKTASLCA